jgi:hypothetical protein
LPRSFENIGVTEDHPRAYDGIAWGGWQEFEISARAYDGTQWSSWHPIMATTHA